MNQYERVREAEHQLARVYEEICDGLIDHRTLQEAVYAQVTINRIVHKLNSIRDEEAEA